MKENKTIPEEVRNYMSKIGKKGGSKSKRRLTSEEARELVRIRVAKQKKKDLEDKILDMSEEGSKIDSKPEQV